MSVYLPPVDELLTLGQPEVAGPEGWPDYIRLGLGSEHVHELLRLALDRSLDELGEDDPAGWAHVHAWRALGQLRAVEAIRPLLQLFRDLSESEWMSEELPDVYALIGPAAIAPLADYLADETQSVEARDTAAGCLAKIAEVHSEWREECVNLLAGQLAQYMQNSTDLNAGLIAHLIVLEATETAPVIEQAFQADRVDESVCGDWDDVQVLLRLKDASELLRQPGFQRPLLTGDLDFHSDFLPSRRKGEDAKVKAKRKQADKSRKQNRKKKKRK